MMTRYRLATEGLMRPVPWARPPRERGAGLREGLIGTTVRLGSTSLLQTGHHTASRSIVGNHFAHHLALLILNRHTSHARSPSQRSYRHLKIQISYRTGSLSPPLTHPFSRPGLPALTLPRVPRLLPHWSRVPAVIGPPASAAPANHLTGRPGSSIYPPAGRSSPHIPTSMATAHLVETRQAHLNFDK